VLFLLIVFTFEITWFQFLPKKFIPWRILVMDDEELITTFGFFWSISDAVCSIRSDVVGEV